jgi:LysR family transcriptional regulator, carnitine catabolism transcriptional activator
MKRINVDLSELQAFARLAELRSFRAAAEELGLSGSALSRLVARVEDKLGARLFDRDTRNVSLTPQGEALRHLTDRILNEAATALTEFDAYLAARRGRVALAGLPSVTASLLPRIVARFVALHPEVEVSIIDALSDGVLAAVLEGRADLGFTAGASDGSGRLSFRPLVEDDLVAVGPPDGPLVEDRVHVWRELAGQPFVAMARGTSVRALTDAACAQAGLTVRPRFEVAHLATAGALVAAGLGITALPSLTLPVLGRGPFVVRRLEAPRMVRRIGIVQATGRTLSPSARAFHRLLTSTDIPVLLAHKVPLIGESGRTW